MIIDLILDRKDGKTYNPREFYNQVVSYNDNDIAMAMDCGDDSDVKYVLCEYINKYNYPPEICRYIIKNNWL